MPRYFFNVSNGSESIDTEGTVLPDVVEARKEAISAAGAIFVEEGDALPSGGTLTMNIKDEDGAVVCTIRCTVQD